MNVKLTVNFLFLSGLVLICSVFTAVQGVDSKWNYQIVDSRNSKMVPFESSSIAVDSQGVPHICYLWDCLLEYAVWNGTGWDVQNIDTAIEPPHLLLDSKGNSHVSYTDIDGLHYAILTGTSWQIQTIDAGGEYPSLALDSNDNPHLSYCGKDNWLTYSFLNGTGWKTEKITSEISAFSTSLALDPSGNPHIGYWGNESISCASWAEPKWTIQRVDPSARLDSSSQKYSIMSLAMDSGNNPHLSYIDNMILKYASWNGLNWDIQALTSTGYLGGYPSLALDSYGYPHISYSEKQGNGDNLRYTCWNGTIWNNETVVNNGEDAFSSSLSLDKKGNPHISYTSGGSLMYATTANLPTSQKHTSSLSIEGIILVSGVCSVILVVSFLLWRRKIRF
jgi:hypothetical protein